MFHFQVDPAPMPCRAIHHQSGSTPAADRAAMVSERLYQRLMQLLRAQTGELDLMALVDQAIVEVALGQMLLRGMAGTAPHGHVAAFVRSLRLAGPLTDGTDHRRAFAKAAAIHEDDVAEAMPASGPLGQDGGAAAVSADAGNAQAAAGMPETGAAFPAMVPETLSGEMIRAEIADDHQPVMEATFTQFVEAEPMPPESHDLMMMIFQDHSVSAGWNRATGQEFSDGRDLLDIAA
jgi:hypothetical protein